MDRNASRDTSREHAIADEWEITRVIYRYANRVDVNDVEGVVACFADDCHVEYGGGAAVLHGRAELRGFLEGALGLRRGNPTPSSHFMTNVLVTVRDNEADVETTAMAVRNLEPGKIIVRGLRYTDVCARVGGSWLIRRREHIPVWEFTTDGDLAPALLQHR
jgi:ketosteroid isomerase-like protein